MLPSCFASKYVSSLKTRWLDCRAFGLRFTLHVKSTVGQHRTKASPFTNSRWSGRLGRAGDGREARELRGHEAVNVGRHFSVSPWSFVVLDCGCGAQGGRSWTHSAVLVFLSVPVGVLGANMSRVCGPVSMDVVVNVVLKRRSTGGDHRGAEQCVTRHDPRCNRCRGLTTRYLQKSS